MLYTKFRENRSASYGENDFKGFYHHGHVTVIMSSDFH